MKVSYDTHKRIDVYPYERLFTYYHRTSPKATIGEKRRSVYNATGTTSHKVIPSDSQYDPNVCYIGIHLVFSVALLLADATYHF